jgi:hypothetical protein
MRILTRASLAVAVALVLFQAAPPLRADLTLIDMFRNLTYIQTSGGVTFNDTFLNLEAHMANSGDFTSVSVAYPGPASPDSLPLVSPTEFGEGPSFPNQAAMDAAYPFGTYLFTATNSVTSAMEQASLDYTVDAFTSDIPELTTATFNALQGMNPALPFTFDFNSFTPNSNASFGTTYLTVFGSSFSTGLSPTATSATLAAGTLLPDTTYGYELDFSDRITGTDPINGVPTLIGFDVRTDGTFTTGAVVPEPAMMIPLGVALLGLAALRLRRFRRSF